MEKINPINLMLEDGTEYTLEFSRETTEWAERRGFDMNDLDKHMMIRVPELFYYAFRMHQPRMTKAQTDKILFDELGGLSQELLTRLCELYAQGYNTLINEEAVKNSKVTITM